MDLTKLTVPNQEYLELTFVGMTATGKGNNQLFTMENMHDGTFRATTSRIGIKVGIDKPRSFICDMAGWDDMFYQKIKRGFILTKTKKMAKKVVKKGGYRDIEDDDVKDIVNFLLMAANQTVEQNYSVSVDDISDEMIEFGKKVLQELDENKDTMSVAAFNAKLHQLYAAIPRRIDNLSKYDAKRPKDFAKKVSDEAELLEFMISQIRQNNDIDLSKSNPTVLEAHGLKWEVVTDEQKEFIKNMLGGNRGQYMRAWKVTNEKTENAFNNFCKQKNLTLDNGVTRLFHGSRTENFWSITTNGLYVNPTGVVITGKAFGNGIYFAPLAKKSLGYTSRSNSYWAHGSADRGYLAIYKVATGEIYDIYREGKGVPLNYSQLQEKHPGADCLWAYAGIGYVVNDEVVIYKENQCTIEYLIEISAY